MADRRAGHNQRCLITGRRERKDGAENRSRILMVARQLFEENGVESVSMHQIAKSAQVGQGTLYRHYAHKGDLCLDLLKESAETFLQQAESWIEKSRSIMTDVEILDAVIVQIVDFTDAKASLLAVINDAQFVGENVFYQQIHHIVSGLLHRILETAAAATVDATLAADILLSAVSPSVYMFERQYRGYSKAQFIAGIRHIYLGGLLSPSGSTRETPDD